MLTQLSRSDIILYVVPVYFIFFIRGNCNFITIIIICVLFTTLKSNIDSPPSQEKVALARDT